MAEGAPLLRAYRVKPIEGSNPSLSATFHSPFSYVCTDHKTLWYLSSTNKKDSVYGLK